VYNAGMINKQENKTFNYTNDEVQAAYDIINAVVEGRHLTDELDQEIFENLLESGLTQYQADYIIDLWLKRK
jgi:hypothetical protein